MATAAFDAAANVAVAQLNHVHEESESSTKSVSPSKIFQALFHLICTAYLLMSLRLHTTLKMYIRYFNIDCVCVYINLENVCFCCCFKSALCATIRKKIPAYLANKSNAVKTFWNSF